MFRRLNKKTITVLSVVGVLALAAGAFAYFISSGGNSTGQASVGTPSGLTVNIGAASGTMLPGSGATTIPFTVTNNSQGHQALIGVTASVKSSSGNITQNGTALTGCQASWFSTSVTPPTSLPQDLAGGATSTGGSVSVSMSNVNSDQSACEGATPDVVVNAS
jgi:hypothetical protein